MTDAFGDYCTCDHCADKRFHDSHFGRVMDVAMPAYQAIGDLVQVNYHLAQELLEVTKERDRLRDELAAAKAVPA